MAARAGNRSITPCPLSCSVKRQDVERWCEAAGKPTQLAFAVAVTAPRFFFNFHRTGADRRDESTRLITVPQTRILQEAQAQRVRTVPSARALSVRGERSIWPLSRAPSQQLSSWNLHTDSVRPVPCTTRLSLSRDRFGGLNGPFSFTGCRAGRDGRSPCLALKFSPPGGAEFFFGHRENVPTEEQPHAKDGARRRRRWSGVDLRRESRLRYAGCHPGVKT